MAKNKSLKRFVGCQLSEKEFADLILKKMTIGQTISFYLREALKNY